MKRRDFNKISASSVLLSSAASSKKKNIVLILADDVSADMFSCYKQPGTAKTPNIDSMAEKVVRGQNFTCIINSLAMCLFCTKGKALSSTPESFVGLNEHDIIEWVNLATGMDWNFSALMQSGDRICNLKHLINLKCGYDPSSDTLHERFITLKRKPSPFADHLPPIKQLVSDYYSVREWNKDGTIKAEKLKKLGLKVI